MCPMLCPSDATSSPHDGCQCGTCHAPSTDGFCGPFTTRLCHCCSHAANNTCPSDQRCSNATICSTHHGSTAPSNDCANRSVLSSVFSALQWLWRLVTGKSLLTGSEAQVPYKNHCWRLTFLHTGSTIRPHLLQFSSNVCVSWKLSIQHDLPVCSGQ